MRVRVLGTRSVPSSVRNRLMRPERARGPAEQIQRREIPYWQERGWVRRGNEYHGVYQTPYSNVRGTIDDRGWGDIRFYMFDPPHALRRSQHWQCFQPRGKKGFHVHMGTRPADVSSGIMTVERLITEAFED